MPSDLLSSNDGLQYYIKCHPFFKNDIEHLMKIYDFKYTISEISYVKIIVNTKLAEKTYDTINDFIIGSIFYTKERNLHYSPIKNKSIDGVIDLDTSFANIIENDSIMLKLFNNKSIKNCLMSANNFSTFIKFPINKIMRLYWNPTINAGMPLSAKEIGRIYEIAFLLHEFGHFIMFTDLIFTGYLTDDLAKKYMYWQD